MKNSTAILLTLTAGLGAAELSAAIVHQSTVSTPGFTVPEMNSPSATEAWLQLVDDYRANRRSFDRAETGIGNGSGLNILPLEATPFGSPAIDEVLEASGAYGPASSYLIAAHMGAANDGSSRAILGERAVYNYVLI